MIPTLRVFIGYEERHAVAYDVLSYSLRKHATIPVSVTPLELRQLAFDRPRDPLQSTEFTYSRFLVPELCEYRGVALYLDLDMLCLADVAEIAALPMDGLALRVVKQEHRPVAIVKMDGRVQTSYPRKNWSSAMLLNCEELRLWTRDAVRERSGTWLHQFAEIPDTKIGELPRGWNDLDVLAPATRLLHFTAGGPWLAEHRDHPHASLWGRYHAELLARLQT